MPDGVGGTAGVSPAQAPETKAEHAGWRSRGYLPHLDAPNLVQHVVFRLADSLPVHIREKIDKIPRVERAQTVDAALDQGFGRQDLALPRNRQPCAICIASIRRRSILDRRMVRDA